MARSPRNCSQRPSRLPQAFETKKSQRNAKIVILKDRDGRDHFYSEWASTSSKLPAFRLGPRKSALGNLPSDESAYPVATWLKERLTDGVQQLTLNSQMLRRASPPSRVRGFKTDGSNLPWLIDSLRRQSKKRLRDWIKHLQTALPDLEDIRTIERPDDRHRYLMLEYRGGLEVPSWMASDGTLRLLALTLPAYLGDGWLWP